MAPLTLTDLFDLCVADGPRTVEFLLALHEGSPRVLREEFCGLAGLSRAWLQRVEGGDAVAVDPAAKPHTVGGVKVVPRSARKADVTALAGFSVGNLHTRHALVRFLSGARQRLARKGLLTLDLYGGTRAFQVGEHIRTLTGPAGERVEYTFEQREADAANGMVTNALSFTVRDKRKSRAAVHEDALVYRWRLWSPPEVRDALADAGFRKVELYERSEGDEGELLIRPLGDPSELPDDWVLSIVARA